MRRTAEYALAHLDRFYIVPGASMRASRLAMKVLPTALTASAIYFLQSRRKSQTPPGGPAGEPSERG